MTLPTIVFIPGAWHTCEYYKHVISILTAKGYPTATVDLPSVGGISPMADDAAAIQKVTSELASDGQEIILVMHSYGGIPGTESAKGLARKIRQTEGKPGTIIGLVYMSAYLLKEGMSVEKCGKWSRVASFLD
jgi:pimeloyl-ACP methyl ester carboxylesterase